MPKALLLILGCAVINYSLRCIPFFLKSKREMPPYLKRFMDYMPIAALGTLIFPGIFTSFPGKPLAGLAGVTAAALCAWFARGLVIPVFASIAATWMVLQYVYVPHPLATTVTTEARKDLGKSPVQHTFKGPVERAGFSTSK